MSFQAYLDTIQQKTGKTPADLRALGRERGWTQDDTLAPGVKPMAIVATLKDELGLGHGHAMAVVALLKGHKKEGDALTGAQGEIAMTVEITGFDWVPDFAKGFVRDLRPRWACEEIGLSYDMRLMDPRNRPAAYFAEQPWGQVPALIDGEIHLFESGAILLHLGERDGRLLPTDRQGRADAISWLFAAYNSVEPMLFELGNVEIFAAGEPWAELRKPSLVAAIGQKLDRLAAAMGERDWLAGQFSIADIAMVTVLRQAEGSGLLADRPVLRAYLERAITRPAFKAALAAQLADFKPEHAPA